MKYILLLLAILHMAGCSSVTLEDNVPAVVVKRMSAYQRTILPPSLDRTQYPTGAIAIEIANVSPLLVKSVKVIFDVERNEDWQGATSAPHNGWKPQRIWDSHSHIIDVPLAPGASVIYVFPLFDLVFKVRGVRAAKQLAVYHKDRPKVITRANLKEFMNREELGSFERLEKDLVQVGTTMDWFIEALNNPTLLKLPMEGLLLPRAVASVAPDEIREYITSRDPSSGSQESRKLYAIPIEQ